MFFIRFNCTKKRRVKRKERERERERAKRTINKIKHTKTHKMQITIEIHVEEAEGLWMMSILMVHQNHLEDHHRRLHIAVIEYYFVRTILKIEQ